MTRVALGIAAKRIQLSYSISALNEKEHRDVTAFRGIGSCHLATEVLPGNAACAILENALQLNRGLLDQYWTWLSACSPATWGIRA